jgi:hypothetical protein
MLGSRAALAIAAAWSVGCSAAKVQSFSVDPPMVCPGQTATVQWQVQGRASLRIERGPHDWDEGEVPSTGSRTVSPAASTSFTVRALDADPAAGASFGTKGVQVPSGPDDRENVAACDAATRKCTASFTLQDGGDALQVRSLSTPVVVRSGAASPGAITVTHGGFQALVATGGSTPASVPAAGLWTLQVDLGPNDPLTPPPRLQVRLDFGCP